MLLDKDIIILINGHQFHTTYSTLTKYKSRLGKMIKSIPDQYLDRPLKLDRDPRLFASILHFLRDGHLVVPKNCSPFELLQEARFFSLREMTESLISLITGIDVVTFPDFTCYSNSMIKPFSNKSLKKLKS
ncbi:hypothetical protein GEMRC1_004747 [Eukaryota sp. GEM-RC1]